MSRYDGLIIPRSYSEYINKTDAATLQQALQLSGVLSGAVAAGDNKAVKSDAVNAILNNNYIKKYSIDLTGTRQNYNVNGYFKIALNQTYGRSVNFRVICGLNALEFIFYKADGAMRYSARQMGATDSITTLSFAYNDTYLYIKKSSAGVPSYSLQIYTFTNAYSLVGEIQVSTQEEFEAANTITIA
jgi:hypothetical protein